MTSATRLNAPALALAACATLFSASSVWAGIINTYTDEATFIGATGASSITGVIPNLGNVGTGPNVVGDVTIDSLSGNLFLGTSGVGGDFETFGWSTLIPGNDIAISGVESFEVTVNLADNVSAFGLVIHEPTSNEPLTPDACNFPTCPDSTFDLTLFLGAAMVDTISFNPANDVLTFFGVDSDMAFNRVTIVENTGNADNEYFGEFFAAKVPEPTTLMLFSLALAGLGGARKRMRH
jgi:hypothetical protein